MQFTVHYRDKDGNDTTTTTDASGSREALKKIKKRLPGLEIKEVVKAK